MHHLFQELGLKLVYFIEADSPLPKWTIAARLRFVAKCYLLVIILFISYLCPVLLGDIVVNIVYN